MFAGNSHTRVLCLNGALMLLLWLRKVVHIVDYDDEETGSLVEMESKVALKHVVWLVARIHHGTNA